MLRPAVALTAAALLSTAVALSQNPAPPAKPPAAPKAAATEVEVRAALAKVVDIPPGSMTFAEFLDRLNRDIGVPVRIDTAEARRLLSRDETTEFVAEYQQSLMAVKLTMGEPAARTAGEQLTQACAQLPGPVSYRIARGQVLIGPAYRPGPEGRDSDDPEQRLGPPVSVAFAAKPLAEAVDELRRLTGANVVADTRGLEDAAKAPVTLTLDNVRLYTALELLGELTGLELVWHGNVYLLTAPVNAQRLREKYSLAQDGVVRQPLSVPAGYLTDGVHLYVKPAELSPVLCWTTDPLGGNARFDPSNPPAMRKK